MKALTDTQWAYLAGIFDGEGSVHLRRSYNKYGMQRSYSLTVTVVCGTELECIQRMAEMVGKDHFEYINGQGNKKYAGRVRLHSNEALEFLKGVLPYLLIKKERAELAIKFQSTKPSKGKRVNDERKEYEELTKQRLTIMNQRGTSYA